MKCHSQFVTHVRQKKKKKKKDCQYALHLFVVDADTENLLGRSEASDLNLVKRLQNINDINSTPSVFGDLEYKPIQCKPVKIKLKEGADPYSLYTARRVPIPLMDKVKAEIERMKASNITEEITEATDWRAGIVPVMKRNGEIRICTYFKHLNKNIKTERYVIPTLDNMLHKLSGAKVFSKLSATSLSTVAVFCH